MYDWGSTGMIAEENLIIIVTANIVECLMHQELSYVLLHALIRSLS